MLLDWVPAHFPRDVHGLGYFDGTHLYEHEDPRLGEHRDWGTKIFNYGRAEVRNFLLGNALFWLERYHIDGLRVDAVASMLYLDYSREPGEWVPNPFGGNENLEAIDFLKRLNELCHQYHPGVLTIAEESTSWTGRLAADLPRRPRLQPEVEHGLDERHPRLHVARTRSTASTSTARLTFSLIYAFTENFMLPLSHDEVVHGKGSLLDKMPGDLWQKYANLRLLYGYMWGHPGKKLLFMGGEFAQWREWKHDESLDWHLLQWESHQGVQRLVGDLNRLYKAEPALHQVDFEWTGFEWLELHDWENSVLAFLRRGRTPGDDDRGRLQLHARRPRRLPRRRPRRAGYYRELLNTDAALYGGSNVGNDGGAWAHPGEHAGRPFHLSLTLPPLAVLFLKVVR